MSVAAVLDDYLDGLLSADTPAAPAQAVAAPRQIAGAGSAGDVTDVTDAGDAGDAADAADAGSVGHAGDAGQAAAAVVTPTSPAPAAVTPAVAPPVPPAPVPAAPAPRLSRPSAPPAPPGPAAMPSAQAAPAEPGDAMPSRRAADRSSRWLRLCCGDQRYGLELLKVQEVVLPVPLLPLRGTAASMLGVMNLRGQVVPVLDLGMYLGKPAQATTAATRFVVLEEHGEVLGLRVSAVEDVVTLAEAQVEAPGLTRVRRADDGLFRGIARQGGAPVVLLDASCLLAPQDHGPSR